MTVDNAHTVLPAVVDVASKNSLFIDSISLQEPQLDDVFLHFTGKALREGGKELRAWSHAMRRSVR